MNQLRLHLPNKPKHPEIIKKTIKRLGPAAKRIPLPMPSVIEDQERRDREKPPFLGPTT